METWQKEFKLKDDLLQGDLENFEEIYFSNRLASILMRSESSVNYGAALRSAIAAGWILEPACEVLKDEKGSKRYFYDGKDVSQMKPGAVDWLGKKIDFVCGTVQTTAINERYRGYCLALEEKQMRTEKQRLHQFDSRTLINNGSCPEREKLLNLVKKGSTDAFVCVNDTTAADLINFFHSRNVKIPQDVRIVGFDDLPIDVRMVTRKQ